MFDRYVFKALIEEIAEVREEEISCDECFEQVDRFIEVELSGLNAAQAMPLVREHLKICGECREEFEALLMALQTMEGSPSSPVSAALTRLLHGIHHYPAP
jgi:hypothetical protein